MSDYRELRWDGDAEREGNVLPLATIVWKDEHPPRSEDQTRPWLCGEGCRETIVRLVAARRCYWRDELIPLELQRLWEEAREELPGWPGFQRLYLSPEDREAIEEWEEARAKQLEEFMAGADQVEITDHGEGFSSFLLTFELDQHGAESVTRPLWKRFTTWLRGLFQGNYRAR